MTKWNDPQLDASQFASDKFFEAQVLDLLRKEVNKRREAAA